MTSAPLLERETGLAAGLARIEQLRAGGSGALCLTGPAGIGKTALLDSLLDAASDLRVLHATAGELEAHAPYGVLRQLLGRPLTSMRADDLDAIAHGAARPAVDLVLHRTTTPVDQSVMLNSLYWLLDGLAAEGPLVVAVDDAHWADEASLLFCQHLLNRLNDLPVLLLVAGRDVLPERRSPALAAIVADPRSLTVPLLPLSVEGVRRCLDAALDGGPDGGLDPGVVAACAEVTGGNPFLVAALAGLLAEAPTARTPGGSATELVRTVVPSTVVDSVVQRLNALGGAEQAVARALAVLESAPLRTVATLAGLPIEDTAVATDHLRDAGLLAPDGRLAFRHALLRNAVDTATGAATRDGLHRQAARALAEEPEGLHLAAGHLLECEGTADPWAVDLLRRAAGAALSEGAPHAAVDLLRRALAEPPAGDDRSAVLMELGLAELHAGDPASVTSLERAGQDVTDPALRAQCALALSTAYHVGGFYDRTVPLLTEALDGLGPEAGDLALVVEAGLVSAALQVPDHVAAARARLAAHGELAGSTPGERLLLAQQAAVANAISVPSSEVRALALRAIGDGLTPEQVANPFEWTIVRLQLAAAGEYAVARALCDQGLDLAAREGSVLMHMAASFVRGWADLWAGRLDDSDTYFTAALQNADLVAGGTIVGVLSAAGRAEALLEQGRTSEARTAVDSIDPDVLADLLHAGGIHLLRARGLVEAAEGDHLAALASFRDCGRRLDALAVDSPTWCAWRAAAVESAWALGLVDEARELAATELARAEEKGSAGVLGQALRMAGEVAPGGCVALLQRAVEVLDGSEARLQEAKARIALGAGLRRDGQRAAGRDQLKVGRELAHRLGAAPLVDHASAELALAGGRVGRIEVSGLASLTSAERRVCELAATGLRNRDIAQRLFVSTKTVEVHLSRAYRKLGVGRDGLRDVLAAG